MSDGVESYAVYAGFGLNVDQAIAAQIRVIDQYRQILAAQKQIEASQNAVTVAIQASATAARDFADQMVRAAGAAQTVTRQAAESARVAQVTRVAGPGGNALVPTGQGRTNTETTGQISPTRLPGPYAPPGGASYSGSVPIPNFATLPTLSDVQLAAYGLQRIGNAAGAGIGAGFEAGAGVSNELARLGTMQGATSGEGFSPDKVAAAYDAAVKTQQEVLGTYVGNNLKLIGSLMSLTQNADQAIALLPSAARAAATLQGLGAADPEAINAALKSAELHGDLYQKGADGREHLDLPAVQRVIKNLVALDALSHNTVGPEQVLAMIRSGGVAARELSDANGFAEMAPLIVAMGAQRAGTGLRAINQQFVSGKMSEAAKNLLIDEHVVKENTPGLEDHYIKNGMGQFLVLPGGWTNPNTANLAAQNPQRLVQDILLPAADAYLASTYGKKFTDASDADRQVMESAQMARLASRLPGGDEMAQILTQAPNIARDIAAFRRMQNGDAYGTAVENNPVMHQKALQAQIDATWATFGQQTMTMNVDALRAATKALRALNDVLKVPGIAPTLELVAAALLALSVSLAAILPVVLAYKSAGLLKGMGGKAGLGGKVGAGAAAIGKDYLLPLAGGEIARDALNAADPGNSMDAWADKHIPGYAWLDYHLNKMVNGTGDDAADRKAFNAARGLDQTSVNVSVKMDSKEIAAQVVKQITTGAGAPSRGSGSFDDRRSTPRVDQ
jgi:hypothetical protein